MMLAAVACTGLLASCDPEQKPGNKDWVDNNLVGQTYGDGSGLKLTYSGAELLGKTATISSCDDNTVTISVAGADYVIEDLMAEDITISTNGLFPGQKVSDLVLPYTRSGEKLTVNGKINGEEVSCNVTGSIDKNTLELNISNAVIAANEPLAGKKLNIVCYDENNGSINEDSPIEDVDALYPWHILWEPSDAIVNIDMGFGTPIPFPLLTILRLTMNIPMIEVGTESTVSITEALQETLKAVEFKADGNIVATFRDEPDAEAQEQETPLNVATYKVLNDHQFALYLNLAAIDNAAAEVSTKAGEEEDPITNGMIKVLTAIPVLMDAYLPMLGDGIVLDYGTSSKDVTSIFLATEFFKPLGAVVGPLLADEDVLAFINYVLSQVEDETGMMGMLPAILEQLPGLIESCTCFELGLNFIAE